MLHATYATPYEKTKLPIFNHLKQSLPETTELSYLFIYFYENHTQEFSLLNDFVCLFFIYFILNYRPKILGPIWYPNFMGLNY